MSSIVGAAGPSGPPRLVVFIRGRSGALPGVSRRATTACSRERMARRAWALIPGEWVWNLPFSANGKRGRRVREFRGVACQREAQSGPENQSFARSHPAKGGNSMNEREHGRRAAAPGGARAAAACRRACALAFAAALALSAAGAASTAYDGTWEEAWDDSARPGETVASAAIAEASSVGRDVSSRRRREGRAPARPECVSGRAGARPSHGDAPSGGASRPVDGTARRDVAPYRICHSADHSHGNGG